MAQSPLEVELQKHIKLAGPTPVRQFMTLCLTHPDHGYYTTRDPLGVCGDFITSPEISQVFGELIGLWAASAWHLMGLVVDAADTGNPGALVQAYMKVEAAPAQYDAIWARWDGEKANGK